MVGSSVWVVVGLWLKWVMGWDWLMVGLKRWICWLVGGLVRLIIGSSDGGSSDDFFLMGLLWWVSNRRRGFLIGGLSLLIGGLGGGCGGRCWLQLVWWLLAPTGSIDGLMVCVCVCVCVCGSVCVVMGLDRLIGVSWVCVCGSMCWTNARGWGRGRKKNTVGKPRKIETCQILKKSDGWKEIIKKDEKIIF